MDIIEFLQTDHERIRAKLTKISQNLDNKKLLQMIRDFITEYEMHETIEEEILFPCLERSGEASLENHELLFDYEKDHTDLWAKLEEMRDVGELAHFSVIQKAFFDFHAFVEAHMRCEERILFPAARARVGKDLLEDLGKKAAEYVERFQTKAVR